MGRAEPFHLGKAVIVPRNAGIGDRPRSADAWCRRAARRRPEGAARQRRDVNAHPRRSRTTPTVSNRTTMSRNSVWFLT